MHACVCGSPSILLMPICPMDACMHVDGDHNLILLLAYVGQQCSYLGIYIMSLEHGSISLHEEARAAMHGCSFQLVAKSNLIGVG